MGRRKEQSKGGTMGGSAPVPKGHVPVSAHLGYLRRLVERGDATAADVAASMDFCRKLIDNPNATERDRNNAAKTIATIAKMTADVALALHKDDRIDDGKPTEIVKGYVGIDTDKV